MTTISWTMAVGLAGLILMGCGGGGGGSDGGTDGAAPAPVALERTDDCDDLLIAFRTEARAKIAVQADELRARGWAYSGGGVPTPVAIPTPAAMPTLPPDGGQQPETSDTNTQVPGVDEADVVETDGDRIYLLHENELAVLIAAPPAAAALAARIPIEGYPLGMFVTNGRALVVSTVSDDGTLGGDARCGDIGAPFPTSPRIENPWFGFFPSIVPPCQPIFTKLTLIDVAATPARTVRELWVEGTYLAARRHGSRARVLVQRDWGVPPNVGDPWDALWAQPTITTEADFVARVDAWERDAVAAIDASALADWAPATRERTDGGRVEHPLTCAQAHVPPVMLAHQGATLIIGLDLASDDAPVDDTLLVGGASHVYANGETLVLAHPEWQAHPLGDADVRTALHVFNLPADATGVAYRGSGFVPGSLLSQFSLDVQEDVVRVATSFTTRGQNVTRLTTARIAEGILVTLGATGDLAPGETLQSARFLGDRAYLVTFLRIDPLFVIDLSDPANPRTLGEVELPGFSEYLHPLDADHLLTIGRDADLDGRTRGVALRLFDVGNPTAPVVTSEYLFPDATWSPAETDHLSFTFEPRLGLLALPVDRYDLSHHSTLHLFDVGTETGIGLRGVVDHGGESFSPCEPPSLEGAICSTFHTMRRGLFIGESVYSIGASIVQVHALDDLTTPLATVTLP